MLFQIVAVVVKYADNVLKGFATSLSILISCAVSAIWFNDITLNWGFVIGSIIVLGAVYVYGMAPSPSGMVVPGGSSGSGIMLSALRDKDDETSKLLHGDSDKRVSKV